MARNKLKENEITVTEVGEEESLGSQPRLRRKPSARAVIQTDDWWLWELAGILLSAAALVAIAGLLSFLDDRPQPAWAHTTPAMKIGSKTIPAVTVAVSPNSLLSLLSTIARICVLIPITKGLGQLKWVWFAEQERNLSDFEAFDNATRGVSGSALLVWKLKFRHFAVVGAAASLLALAFDPFVQNLLSYYSKGVEDPTIPAQLPRVYNYSIGDDLSSLDTSMMAAINAGYSLNPGYDVPQYYCASGNCTWADTVTLGVCSRCADVSSQLSKTCVSENASSADIKAHAPTLSCNLTLPNGFSLNTAPDTTTNVFANVTINEWDSPALKPLVFGRYSYPIALMHSIYASSNDVGGYLQPSDGQTTFYANECALIPCVQVLSTMLNSATGSLGGGSTSSFTENVTGEYTTYDFALEPLWSGMTFSPNNDQFGNGTFAMSATAAALMNGYLLSVVPGTVERFEGIGGTYWYNTLSGAFKNTFYRTSVFLQNVFTADPETTCDPSMHDRKTTKNWEALRFQCAIENMATAMSVRVRNSIADSGTVIIGPNGPADDATLADLDTSSPLIAIGKTMVSKTYIAVTWFWLALPVLLWVLAVVMFIGTVWKTRKAGIRTWRTNTLAPFFLGMGIDQEKKEKVEQLPMTTEGLERKAQELKVKLHLNEQEARWVGG